MPATGQFTGIAAEKRRPDDFGCARQLAISRVQNVGDQTPPHPAGGSDNDNSEHKNSLLISPASGLPGSAMSLDQASDAFRCPCSVEFHAASAAFLPLGRDVY